jgi:hypothetical protein
LGVVDRAHVAWTREMEGRTQKKIRLSLFIYWKFACFSVYGVCSTMLLPLLLLPFVCEKLSLMLLCLYINRLDTKNGLWINRMILFNWIIIGFLGEQRHINETLFLDFCRFCLWAFVQCWGREEEREWVAIINQLRRTNDVMSFLFVSFRVAAFLFLQRDREKV